MSFQNGVSPSANGNPFLQFNRGNPFPSGEENRVNQGNGRNPRYKGRPENYNPNYNQNYNRAQARYRGAKQKHRQQRDRHHHHERHRYRRHNEYNNSNNQDEEFYEEEEGEDVVVDDQVREKEEQVKGSFEQRHYHHHSHHIHLPEGINPLQVAVAMNGGEINVNMIDIDDFTLLANRHNALRSEIRAFLITIAREHPDNHQVIQRWVNNLIEHYPNCELAKALASDADNSSINSLFNGGQGSGVGPPPFSFPSPVGSPGPQGGRGARSNYGNYRHSRAEMGDW
ncbi:hypothetical protein K449DRAFT_435017 [Hypoxylon sp. EC38]|nr:hypothetical protein K449DRAFT_435017 [Hypoxylon sp. EC38]